MALRHEHDPEEFEPTHETVSHGGLPRDTVTERETMVAPHEDVAYIHQRASYDALVRAEQFVWLVIGIIEAFIALRIGLKLIAANPANPFASFVYGVSQFFLAPFFGLTINPTFDNGVVLELTSLFGLLVYWLVGWGLTRLVWAVFYRSTRDIVSTVEHRG